MRSAGNRVKMLGQPSRFASLRGGLTLDAAAGRYDLEAMSKSEPPPPKRPLSPAAERALAEAAARRAEAARKEAEQPKELKGRGGLDPTRYGDWEINGLTSDF
jgi:hypothetical protein